MNNKAKKTLRTVLASLRGKKLARKAKQAIQGILAFPKRKGRLMEPAWLSRLHTLRLQEYGYWTSPEIEEQVLLALRTEPLAGAFLAGPPGAGKTYLAEVIAGALGLPLLVQQLFPGSTEETLFVRILPDEQGDIKSVEGILIEAARLLGALPGTSPTVPGVVILLDEWDKSRPSADGILLDFLQRGRIRYGNIKARVPLDRLIVFITTNEERDISEPLRRRLCRIELPPLPIEAIERLLVQSHPNHPLLPLALQLYRFSLHPKMPRPFSLQELRQFLSAATQCGPTSLSNNRLDTLIYQFLTKSREAHTVLHTLIEKQETLSGPPPTETKVPEYLQLIRPWKENDFEKIIQRLPEITEKFENLFREKAHGILRLTEGTWQILQVLSGFQPETSPGQFAAGRGVRTPHGPQIFLKKPLHLKDLSHFLQKEVQMAWGEIALHFPKLKPSLHNQVIRFSIAKTLTDICGLTLVQNQQEGMVFTAKGVRLWVGLPHPELLVEVPLESVTRWKILGLFLRDAGNPYWVELAREQSWRELQEEIVRFLESLPPRGADGLPWGAAFPLPPHTWGLVYLDAEKGGRLYLPKAILRPDPHQSFLGEKMNPKWGYPCNLEKHRVRICSKGSLKAARDILIQTVHALYGWLS